MSLMNDITYPTEPYAILSHTWGEDDKEVSFDDLNNRSEKTKDGYEKLRFCGEQAARDGIQYFWVDTCCINKSSDRELSEAINSMFRWYRKAAKCYAYLTDLSINDQIDLSLQPWEAAFGNSRWFSRGWTLQELIAPPSVEFFCSKGRRLGDKKSLEGQLHKITGIPISALRGRPLVYFSFDERVLWARNRETKREEDLAYSLIGFLDISIPIIYGNCCVAFSPDSRLLASASYDETMLWDTATGALQRMLDGLVSVAFSPDSRILASASDLKVVWLWDVATGALQLTLHGHSDLVTVVAFSPDSRLLASASIDKTVRLWDAATGVLKIVLEGYSHSVRSVAFSPDSRLLASASYDKTVRLWDAATGASHLTLEGFKYGARSVAFSPDSRLLASASCEKIVRFWDASTGASVQEILQGHDYVCSVAFSPDSRLLASASASRNTVKLWGSATPRDVMEQGPVNGIKEQGLVSGLVARLRHIVAGHRS
ncbi:HET-domain containing [Hyphodiscus hymeniophilus]|uniref:HET-domain containing n=1 Tax=Hyphodiscus hymeniophilus TaxID=353542 RepID=A0A9P6SKF3_9HELO|nr:HET-domain containing [Hyphodiscus hymeniophilus]